MAAAAGSHAGDGDDRLSERHLRSKPSKASSGSAAGERSAKGRGTSERVVDAEESMDCRLGRELASSSTSANWSTLPAVAKKVSKRLGWTITPRELDAFMIAVGDKELEMHGVWRHSFGKKYMPIVAVNPACGRQKQVHGMVCMCGVAAGAKAAKEGGRAARYFGSHDYNAGRHSATISSHKISCPMWAPSDAGHQHSWRRGFED